MPWLAFQALFTAVSTPLLLMVAPLTMSMASAATFSFLPTNCARKALLFFTWPRKAASISLSESPTAMPVITAFSSTEIATGKMPFRPLPSAVHTEAPRRIAMSASSPVSAVRAA